MGYKQCGRVDYCGYKFGQWFSMTEMDKLIGEARSDVMKVLDFETVRGWFGV